MAKTNLNCIRKQSATTSSSPSINTRTTETTVQFRGGSSSFSSRSRKQPHEHNKTPHSNSYRLLGIHNPSKFLFVIVFLGNMYIFATSSLLIPSSYPRSASASHQLLRRASVSTRSTTSAAASTLAFGGANTKILEQRISKHLNGNRNGKHENGHGNGNAITRGPIQHSKHGFRSAATVSKLSLLSNDNNLNGLMTANSLFLNDNKKKIRVSMDEIYTSIRMKSTSTTTTSTATTRTMTTLKSKSCPEDNDIETNLEEPPRFLDENPSNPAAYQIPPFQKGDDFLTDLPKGQRIISFGDVHGDILALYKFLKASQLLHEDSTITNPIWDGGSAILVQCGDILDRGAEELFCLRYLASLARQAPKHGGRVILLHGNHEALNANGLFQYADPLGNEEIEVVLGKHMDECKSEGSPRWRLQYAGNQPTRWAAFEPNGWLAKPLYKNMCVAAVVGKTVFVHAGLTKDHLRKYGGIEGMNQECREWFTTDYPDELKNDDGLMFTTVQEVIDNANLRARTASKAMPECLGGGIGAASPVWMRDYSSPSNTAPKEPVKAQKMIDECLEELGHGVERMVMGHTPQRNINAALKGKAWRVDVGASKGVSGGTPEVMEIIHEGGANGEDVINILTVDGKRIPAAERQIIEIPF